MLKFSQVCQLLRLQALGGTAHWPMLATLLAAAGSVADGASPSVLALLVLISFAFNNFGYLMNDLADITLDRQDPARQNHPLVSGDLNEGTMQLLMWAQLPLLAALHWYGDFSAASAGWLTLAVVLLGTYNRFSKSCRWPLLMDTCLGASAFCLVIFGATSVSADAFGMVESVLVFATGACLCLMMINAFHNNLRDLDYEQFSGRRNTAIAMGATMHASGAPIMGARMAGYGWGLQLVLVGLAYMLCYFLHLDETQWLVVTFANLFNAALFGALVKAQGVNWQRLSSVHLMTMPLPMMLAILAIVPATQQLWVVLVYGLPPVVLIANRPAWRTDRFAEHARQALRN